MYKIKFKLSNYIKNIIFPVEYFENVKIKSILKLKN